VKIYLTLLSFILSANIFGMPSHIYKHVPLQLTLKESQNLLKSHWFNLGNGILKSIDNETEEAISGGEKLAKWIKKLNKNRSATNQIRLTNKSLRKGIPIESPSKYGPKTIMNDLQKLKETIPRSILEIVYSNSPLSDKIPSEVTLVEFIKYGRKINKLYQTAVRWTTVIEPWLSWFSQNKVKDVRGYFTLSKIKNLDMKLNKFSKLGNDEKTILKESLLGICINNYFSRKQCLSKYKIYLNINNLVSFKDRYIKQSKIMWDSYFKITNPRSDTSWTSKHPNELHVPFSNIKNKIIADWLSFNVEDEFKTKEWNLKINYITPNWDSANLKFKSGVTPHVTGGNTIVMDENTSIEEYSVRWTIRHEFGHILRLPDCYVEFYDSEQELAINYQLDITNLMCSRAGDFHLDNFKELKRVYFKE